MLEGAFSFRGRIGRLNYFLASLLMIPAAIVAALFVVMLMAGAQRGVASLAFFAFVGLLMVIVGGWYSLSLYVRRIRDIGWDPATVLIGWFMIACADVVLARIIPALALGHSQTGTAIGSLVNLGLSLALLFWPGHARGDIAAVFDGPAPSPARGASRLDALVGGGAAFESPAAAVAAPVRLPGAAPQGFGRRGLR